MVSCRAFVPAVLVMLFSVSSYGEVILARKHYLAPHDRRVTFSIALTPDQALLSLVPKLDGNWQLTRTSNWTDKAPKVETIKFRSYGSNTPDLRSVDLELFVSPNGRFAVCASQARIGPRKGRGNRVAQVVVVDLLTFTVVRTTELLLPGYSSVYMLPTGKVLFRNRERIPGSALSGTPDRIWMQLVKIPDLTSFGTCTYMGQDFTHETPRMTAIEPGCAQLAKEATNGAESFNNFADAKTPRAPVAAANTDCQPLSESADGRFRQERCAKSSFNVLLERYITKDYRVNIYSTANGNLVGSVALDKRNTSHTVFAVHGQFGYLLVVEGGTRFRAYRIIDQ